MENNNIVLVRHHPMNVKYTNTFYTSQVEDLSNYTIIDVTSRCLRDKDFMSEHPSFAKDISPLLMGPVITSDGLECKCFEHFWQCGKVYPCHFVDGKLTDEFFEWRKRWYDKPFEFSKKVQSRHPNQELGYKPSDCLFNVIYKDGEYKQLSYVESRKQLYIPEYAKLVYNTPSFKWLKSLVDSGKKIALVDFDAYNYYSKQAMGKIYEFYLNKCKKNGWNPNHSLSEFENIKDIKDVVNCSFLAGGHAVTLKLLLQGDIEVKDGIVIDNIGVLN